MFYITDVLDRDRRRIGPRSIKSRAFPLFLLFCWKLLASAIANLLEK
jgi:hypothetical protein